MRLGFFDMDKTLTPVISAVFMGEQLGLEKEVGKLERLVGVRKITNEAFTRRLGALVKGRSLAELRRVYEKMPLRRGLRETVSALKDYRVRSAVVTGGVGLFADFLQKDYGFDGVLANSTIQRGGVVEAFGPPIVGRRIKPVYVAAYQVALGVAREECFAVGDSQGDVLMFQAVGTSIALKPRESIEATHVLHNCNDLREILPYVLR